MGTAEEELNTAVMSGTWKEIGAKWMAQQGAPVVLLFCILGFIAYGAFKAVPDVWERQEKERVESREAFSKMANEQRTDYIKSIEKTTDQMNRSLDTMTEKFTRSIDGMTDKFTRSIDSLSMQLRGQKE